MNEAFEKILEMLEELRETYDEMAFIEMNTNGHTLDFEYAKGKKDVMLDVKKIVQEVAEEYNNGWIACSDRLPNDFMSMEYLTTVKGRFYSEINYYCVANHKWFSSEETTKEVDVIAWQPLPEYFKDRD